MQYCARALNERAVCEQLVSNDIIEASAKIAEQTLPPPRYFRGDARKVLPLMQATEADLQLCTGR